MMSYWRPHLVITKQDDPPLDSDGVIYSVTLQEVFYNDSDRIVNWTFDEEGMSISGWGKTSSEAIKECRGLLEIYNEALRNDVLVENEEGTLVKFEM